MRAFGGRRRHRPTAERTVTIDRDRCAPSWAGRDGRDAGAGGGRQRDGAGRQGRLGANRRQPGTPSATTYWLVLDLLPALVSFFARTTETTLARGLFHSYREQRDRLVAMRGRVDIARQLAQSGLVIPMHCKFTDFTADLIENSYLKAAVSRSLRVAGVQADRPSSSPSEAPAPGSPLQHPHRRARVREPTRCAEAPSPRPLPGLHGDPPLGARPRDVQPQHTTRWTRAFTAPANADDVHSWHQPAFAAHTKPSTDRRGRRPWTPYSGRRATISRWRTAIPATLDRALVVGEPMSERRQRLASRSTQAITVGRVRSQVAITTRNLDHGHAQNRFVRSIPAMTGPAPHPLRPHPPRVDPRPIHPPPTRREALLRPPLLGAPSGPNPRTPSTWRGNDRRGSCHRSAPPTPQSSPSTR